MERNVEFFMTQINPTIEQSLSFEQKQEMKRVIGMALPVPSKKIIDLRTTFWCVRRLYLVVYIGEDRRKVLRGPETFWYARLLGRIIELGIAFVLFLFFFFLLYWIKTLYWIDLFPDKHLGDFLHF